MAKHLDQYNIKDKHGHFDMSHAVGVINGDTWEKLCQFNSRYVAKTGDKTITNIMLEIISNDDLFKEGVKYE
jgi:hypothetical protein